MQIQRFWLLDNVRGLASLSVVLFHYQHFYQTTPGVVSPLFNQSLQPFYFFLSPFYEFGYNAVQLFFTLSGFVFFFVYYRGLREGSVTGREFVVARFSRLYPLHFATLLFVACGQHVFRLSTGEFFVYSFNDAYHFLLNVLFISDWGLQAGESFNGPIWSVSIEILLYLLFFCYAKLFSVRPSRYLATTVITWLVLLFASRLAPPAISVLIHSALCFFIGGIAFLTWQKCSGWKRSLQTRLFIVLVIGGTFGLIWFAISGYRSVLDFIVFPALVLAAAIVQSAYANAGKRTCILGDISYSTYLLHFPLQLFIVLVALRAGAVIDFNRPEVFLGFLMALLVISALTYYYFERPVQNYIRGRLNVGKKVSSLEKTRLNNFLP